MAEVVTLDRVAHLSEPDRDAIRTLTTAVYPPAESADWPGRGREWSAHDWCVRVHARDGALLSYVGLVVRDARHDGQARSVGGIGGVKTHPAARGRGHAARAVERAVAFLHERGVAFAVLVCQPPLIVYYEHLGWRPFAGRLLVRQHGAVEEFTFNRVMTRSVTAVAPESGTIDLLGPPW